MNGCLRKYFLRTLLLRRRARQNRWCQSTCSVAFAGKVPSAACATITSCLQPATIFAFFPTMMDGLARQHSASCPLSSKPRLPRRLQFKATQAPRPPVTVVSSKAPNCRPALGNTVSCGILKTPHQRSAGLVCSAVAPPSATAAAPAQQVDNIPRGETAGANLILENATVQAGHRDLLEVSNASHTLPSQPCIKAVPKTV